MRANSTTSERMAGGSIAARRSYIFVTAARSTLRPAGPRATVTRAPSWPDVVENRRSNRPDDRPAPRMARRPPHRTSYRRSSFVAGEAREIPAPRAMCRSAPGGLCVPRGTPSNGSVDSSGPEWQESGARLLKTRTEHRNHDRSEWHHLVALLSPSTAWVLACRWRASPSSSSGERPCHACGRSGPGRGPMST